MTGSRRHGCLTCIIIGTDTCSFVAIVPTTPPPKPTCAAPYSACPASISSFSFSYTLLPGNSTHRIHPLRLFPHPDRRSRSTQEDASPIENLLTPGDHISGTHLPVLLNALHLLSLPLYIVPMPRNKQTSTSVDALTQHRPTHYYGSRVALFGSTVLEVLSGVLHSQAGSYTGW